MTLRTPDMASADAARVSLSPVARAAGATYVLITASAIFAEFFVRGTLVVRGDAAATAEHIAQSETLFRIGIAADIVTLACDCVLAALLYMLFSPANRTLAAVAAALRLGMASMASIGVALSIIALNLVTGDASTPAHQPSALDALQARSQIANAAMIFFAAHLLAVGWLVWRSTYLPRILAPLLMIAGACYLANSIGSIVFPGVLRSAFPYFAAIWAIAEWSFALWLLIVGVKARKKRDGAG